MSRTFLIILTCLSATTTAVAATCTDAPKVSEVYPTGDVLPENLLRFYIYFTKPMKRHNALENIDLLDSEGDLLQGVFLTNKVDLWSPDGHRLTILFDPGRVKTGLVAHNEMGRALESSQTYSLKVGNSFIDMNGCTLASAYYKEFRVEDADFEKPDLEKWNITKPQSDTKEKLFLELNGAHDHVSLAYRIRVIDDEGSVVPGVISLGPNEDVWQFKPKHPWQTVTYEIRIDPALEDIVGNRMTGSFEQPLEIADNSLVLFRSLRK